jgi:hypothetical protein
MRTTLSLDDDVLAAARALAEATGGTIGEVVSELARRGLAVRDAVRTSGERSGIPLFPVRADAGIVTPEIVRALLHDDEPSDG